MLKHMRNQNTNADQQGIVSIVVTIILMLVITLIVLSFAKISRREQRNALDRQLSTQAFYAAESGVNDAKKVIESWASTNDARLPINYMNTCDQFATAAGAGITLSAPLFAGSAASYTCLFVDATPPEFEYTRTDAQVIFPFNPVGGGNQTIKISWDDGDPGTNYSAANCPGLSPGNNPVSSATCAAPLLRIEIANLASSITKVIFAYPGASDSSPTFGAGLATGSGVTGLCGSGATPKECSVTINSVPAGSYVRVKSIYRSVALTIQANSGAELIGGQVIIDSTGKAADVVRRIQVRIPYGGTLSNPPAYSVQGTDKVCKKFSIDGTGATDDGPCSIGPFPD